MEFNFSGMKIEGVLSIEVSKAGKMEKASVSDTCVEGIRYLLSNDLIEKQCIAAILSVSLTPDTFFPGISCEIHRQLELDDDVICIDIARGASGYIEGLMQAFMLLNSAIPDGQAVLLCTGDFYNRIKPMADEPEQDDVEVASITMIKKTSDMVACYCNILSDVQNHMAVKMPLPKWCFNEGPEHVQLALDKEAVYQVYKLTESRDLLAEFVNENLESVLKKIADHVDKSDEKNDYGFSKNNNVYGMLFVQDSDEPFVRDEINKMSLKDLIVESDNPRNRGMLSSFIPNIIANSSSILQNKDTYTRATLIGFGAGFSIAGAVLGLGKMRFCEKVKL